MSIQELISWLEKCPVLQGQKMNFSFLPSYQGWSLTIPKSETRADILGNSRTTYQLKITRRYTVQSNDDRIAVLNALEDLADWAKQNLPPGTRLRVSGFPEFTSRNTSGTEDLSIMLTLAEQ